MSAVFPERQAHFDHELRSRPDAVSPSSHSQVAKGTRSRPGRGLQFHPTVNSHRLHLQLPRRRMLTGSLPRKGYVWVRMTDVQSVEFMLS